MLDDEYWMNKALLLADRAAQNSEIPVGAIVVMDDQLIGEGVNAPISTMDPTAHAEIQAIRAACTHFGNYRLSGATLFVTLEPCAMCAGAIVHARINRVVFAAKEPKSGAVCSQQHFFEHTFLNHKVSVVSGVLAEKASAQLTNFFQFRREQKKRLKNVP